MTHSNNTMMTETLGQEKKIEIISQAINIWNFIACIWIFFSLKNFANHERQKMNRNSFLINISCYISVLPFIRVVTTQSMLFVKWFFIKKNDQACQILMHVSAMPFFLSLLFIYLYPWARQKFIYKQPSISRFNTKCMKIFSNVLFIYLVVGCVTLGIFHIVLSTFEMDLNTGECVMLETTSKDLRFKKVTFFLVILGFVVNQVLLLYLFMRPLSKHRNSNTTDPNNQVSQQIKSIINHAIGSLVLNTLATVVIGVLGTNSYMMHQIPGHLRNSVFDIGMTTLLFSVVVSFEKWIKILTFSISSSNTTENIEAPRRDSNLVSMEVLR